MVGKKIILFLQYKFLFLTKQNIDVWTKWEKVSLRYWVMTIRVIWVSHDPDIKIYQEDNTAVLILLMQYSNKNGSVGPLNKIILLFRF